MAIPLFPETLQSANDVVFQYLLDVDLQHKCKFEFSLFRNPLDNLSGSLTTAITNTAISALGVGADVLVSKFYLKSIEYPQGLNYEHERLAGNWYVINFAYPEEITFTFIEQENGLVRRYLSQWQSEVAAPSIRSTLNTSEAGTTIQLSTQSPSGLDGGYVFKDNQEAAKRTGMLVLKPKSGDIDLLGYPRIMFYGISLASIANMMVGQGENDNMEYSVTCKVDEVKIPILV